MKDWQVELKWNIQEDMHTECLKERRETLNYSNLFIIKIKNKFNVSGNNQYFL